MDAPYCILLVLSMYLEEWIKGSDRQLTDFLFCNEGQTPEALNRSVYVALKTKVTGNLEFLCVGEDGCLGTHSFKKLGATHLHHCSCFKDDVDARANWKRKNINRMFMLM
eukprot:8506266-Ditylum_brightwellii.AAC.1